MEARIGLRVLRVKKSAGFSLVELMVVVAIIGILAAMSMGQIQKQIAKARQSEAKTNLAMLYTAEKTFWSEFATFCTDFRVIGISYEGDMRYFIGFALDHKPYADAVTAGYTPAVGGGSGVFAATNVTCAAAPLGNCRILESSGLLPLALAGTSASGSIYTASSSAYIFLAANIDVWTINQDKMLVNSTPGIP
jgi:type IV pilus assembly protein PilA